MNKFRETIAVTTVVLSIVFTAQHAAAQASIVSQDAKPAIFLQEGVSAPNKESTPTFTPDERTMFLNDNQQIAISKWQHGNWTKPETVPFSGHWMDWDPFLSPDGKRLIFVSNRPVPGVPEGKKNNHLWYVDCMANGQWSEPKHIGEPVNVDGAVAYAPAVDRKGNIYFCSRNRDGNKGMAAYCAKWLGDHYDKPVKLALNGDNDVFDPFISADGRYLVYASKGNLYISYKQGDGWSAGQDLGPQVNNGVQNGSPYISPDSKTLYYSSAKTDGILMIPVHIPKTS